MFSPDIFCVAGSKLFGWATGKLYRSDDTGYHWLSLSPGLNNTPSGFIGVIGECLIAQCDSGIYQSRDTGNIWRRVGNGPPVVCKALGYIGTTFYAASGSSLFFTQDSGLTWKPVVFPLTGEISALSSTKKYLFAASRADGLWRSANDGIDWVHIGNRLPETVINSIQNGSPGMFASTDSGLYNSLNDGNDWVLVNSNVRSSAHSSVIGDLYLFAGYDTTGIYYSADRGANWTSVSEGLPKQGVQGLGVNVNELFAGLTGGGVWRRPLIEMGISSVPRLDTELAISISVTPNPFPQYTNIRFSTQEIGSVQISIINILGSEVAHLFSGELEAGEHNFNWDALSMTEGVYWCVVRMNGNVERSPMILKR